MLSDRELLAAVRGATDDFTVYGELGRHGESLAALLAREVASNRLVVLMVQANTGFTGEVELSIEVKYELDARIPDGGTKCPACGSGLRPWVRFCTKCGHDVAGQAAMSDVDRAKLREAVVDAVQDDYEFLGEIKRSEGGGNVFFARERESGRIVALRLNQSQGDGEFELGETNILRRAAPVAEKRDKPPLVSVTQVLRKLDDTTKPDFAASPSVSRENRRGGNDAMGDNAGKADSASTNDEPISLSGQSGWHPLLRPPILISGAILTVIVAILATLVFR